MEPISIAFVPNKTEVIYSYDSECIYVWNYDSGIIDKKICKYSNLLVHVIPNTLDLASVTSEGRISIINLATNEEKSFFKERD